MAAERLGRDSEGATVKCTHHWVFAGYWHATCRYCGATYTHHERPERVEAAFMRGGKGNRATKILTSDFLPDPSYWQRGSIYEGI